MAAEFTDNAAEVMDAAGQQAVRLGHGCVGTEHIFLALVMRRNCRAAIIVQELGVDIDKMLGEIGPLLSINRNKAESAPEPQLDPHAIRALEHAAKEAESLGAYAIGTEHLLLGLLRTPDSIASMVLTNLAVTPEKVRRKL